MRELRTARLTLRPLELGDVDDLHRLYGDPQVMRYIIGRPRSREETEGRLDAHIAQYRQYGFGLCAAILLETGEMVGRCGYEPREEATGLAGEMAWMFGQPWWGLGLGIEVGTELVRYGLEVLSLHRIFALADVPNVASIAIMKRLGMQKVYEDPRQVEYELRRAR